MKNTTIIWYIVKYFVFVIATVFAWQYAGTLCTAKNDMENVMGYALFVGLFLTWVLLLKSEVTKIVTALLNDK